MSVRLSCPSCNTNFTLDAVPGDRRATCPRCGDPFPVRGEVSQEPEDREQRTEDRKQAVATTPATKRGRPVSRAASVALTLGLIALAVGLVVYYTRGKPQPTPDDGRVPPLGIREPLDYYDGLVALPSECNVVFAVRPKLVLEYAARANQDPREVLQKSGIPSQALTALDQLGLSLADIDHVVGGAFIGNEGDELRAVIVIKVKRPTDTDATLKKLKAKQLPKNPGLFRVDFPGVPLPLLLSAGREGYLLGLNERDFQHKPGGVNGQQGQHLRGVEVRDGQERLVGIRKMLQAVPLEAAIWIAADGEGDWTQKPLVKLAAQASRDGKTWLPAVSGGRGGLLTITFDEHHAGLQLKVRCADEATAEQLLAYFKSQEAANKGSSYRDGLEVHFGAPFDPATSWPMLQRFLDDARK
jgi:hypothetical protein